MTILFPNLFTDPQEYLQAQTLWRQLFSRIESESANDTVWLQWMTETYGDGTPIRDCSSPIFTRICRDRGKAITIRQHIPGEEWNTDKILHACMEPCGAFGEIDTLDISCVLTEDSLAQAEALIRLYMVDDLLPEEMELHLGTELPMKEDTTGAKHTLVLASLHYGLRKHFCALRGARGACRGGFGFTPGPSLVINMDIRFSEPDGREQLDSHSYPGGPARRRGSSQLRLEGRRRRLAGRGTVGRNEFQYGHNRGCPHRRRLA